MNFIELPAGIDKIEKDEKGHPYFTYNLEKFFLKDVLAGSKNQQFNHTKSGLRLFVGNHCPNTDNLFVEFLPITDKSSGWCVVHNGRKKNEESRRIGTQSVFVYSELFRSLGAQRKGEILAARQEQREDRRTKGPKSV